MPLPGSAGGPTGQLQNIGRVTNKGLELSSNVTAVDMKNVQFTALLNFATLENKLISLRSGLSDVVFGLGGATQRFSPGGYFQPKYTYGDANNNGIIEPSEVTLAADQSTAGQYVGNILPKRTFSAQPALTLFRNLRVQALFDRRNCSVELYR